MEISDIQKFYRGSSVFLTGGTGFLGKLIIEKLLRTCFDVENIYLLIRPKKGKTIEARFDELFEDVVFERLKKEVPNVKEKVNLIAGDCSLPNLGINDADRKQLCEKCNIVFHCAATVRFVEKLRQATHINVRATKDILHLCREMKDLKAIVHVSTAFANCPKKEINEDFYDGPITAAALLESVESLEEKSLDNMTQSFLGDWPNTYAFTKSVAENVIKTEGKGLPVTIVRPSIVISTLNEPIPGWIDNFYGPTGIVVGAAVGLLRTMHAHPDKKADIVPADYVINNCIAAAWEVAVNRNEKQKDNSIPIYNYVSSTQNPITWHEYMEKAEINCKKFPSPIVMWHYSFTINKHKFMNLLYTIFLHFLPAICVDTVARCIGKKPMLWKAYSKIYKFSHVISYFSTSEWKFYNDNVQNLWKKLSETDKELFPFDISAVDWNSYFYYYAKGGRLYLLKDPLDTLEAGRKKLRKLMIAHYTVVTILCLVLLRLAYFMFSCIFPIN